MPSPCIRSRASDPPPTRRLRHLRRAATKVAAAAVEGGQKLSTLYKGSAEANPSNYVLLSVRGKVRAENIVGDRWSSRGGRGNGTATADQRNNLTRSMNNRKLTASRTDLADKKAESNRGRVRGSGPAITRRILGWTSRGF